MIIDHISKEITAAGFKQEQLSGRLFYSTERL